MKKVWRNVVLLTLVVCGLGALALFGPEPEQGAETRRLTALDPTEIERIRLERPQREAVNLTRRDGNWQLDAPLEARANPIRAAALASLAGASTNLYYDVSEVELDALGLGEDALRLTLNDVQLAIGTREEVKDLRYVRAGDTVFLLQDRFYHHVSAAVPGFVDPAPLAAPGEITAITTSAVTLSLDNGLWQWQPADAFSSADDAAARVAAWRNLSALAVTFADYQATWQPAVTVIYANGDQVRFMKRSADNRVWLMQPELDLQYELPRPRARALGLVAD